MWLVNVYYGEGGELGKRELNWIESIEWQEIRIAIVIIENEEEIVVSLLASGRILRPSVRLLRLWPVDVHFPVAD